MAIDDRSFALKCTYSFPFHKYKCFMIAHVVPVLHICISGIPCPNVKSFFFFQVFKCAYVMLIMATFWATEALPLAITSLIPIVLLPLLGKILWVLIHILYFTLIKQNISNTFVYFAEAVNSLTSWPKSILYAQFLIFWKQQCLHISDMVFSN